LHDFIDVIRVFFVLNRNSTGVISSVLCL